MLLHRRLLLCVALLVPQAPALADIYRYYDSDGNLVLSDSVPKDNPEKVQKLEPRPVMTVPALQPSMRRGRHAESQSRDADRDTKPGSAEYVIVIQSPAAESTFRRGGDGIPVAVSISPALQNGSRLELLLDGKAIDGASQISADDLDRGSHVLVAQVVDAGGKVLKSVASTFYVQQHSIQGPLAPKAGKPDTSKPSP